MGAQGRGSPCSRWICSSPSLPTSPNPTLNELLGNMLKDLDQRDEVIKKPLADSKAELEDHKKSLVEYEKQLVDLQNAADAAQMKATNQNLLRQKLNGEKTNAAEAYEEEHAEYVVVAPPADRTIYVLKVIMAKINEYCAHGTISTLLAARGWFIDFLHDFLHIKVSLVMMASHGQLPALRTRGTVV